MTLLMVAAFAANPDALLVTEALGAQRAAGNITFLSVGDNQCRDSLPEVEDRERFATMPLELAVAEANALMPYETTLTLLGGVQIVTAEGLGPDCLPATVDSPWLKTVPPGEYKGIAGLENMFERAGSEGFVELFGEAQKHVPDMTWIVSEPTPLATVLLERKPTSRYRASFLVGVYRQTDGRSQLFMRHVSTHTPMEDLPKYVQEAIGIRANIADCRKRQARGEGCGESEYALRAQEWLLELARSDPSLLTPPEDSWGPDIPPVPEDFVPKIGITEPSYPIPEGFWLVDEHGQPLPSAL